MTERSSPVSEVLKQAHAALLRIRTASIAGCEEGYGKPEKWADELFASHGDVTAAMKVIEGLLSSGHAPRPDYVRGLEDAALIVERWSLPTIQTPSMWLVDKAGIAADIRALRSDTSTDRPAFYGAQCPSYPNCTGGCGLGCTHEIEQAAGSSTVCATCNGRGVVGGFVSATSGYQNDPCPDCSQSSPEQKS